MEREQDGTRFRFQFLNGVPLNGANFDGDVNLLEYWEIRPDGRTRHFSWVTDREVTASNAVELMRTGRARLAHRERDIQTTYRNESHGIHGLSTQAIRNRIRTH